MKTKISITCVLPYVPLYLLFVFLTIVCDLWSQNSVEKIVFSVDGENDRPINVLPEHHPLRDMNQEGTLIPQQTFRSLSDSNTTLVGRWAQGSCYAVAVSGNIAYFGKGEYLGIVDFSDPANPQELGQVLMLSLVKDIALSGNYAYVTVGSVGLRVIDVSASSNPTEVGFYDTGGYARGVAISGNYAYVADDYAGLRVIDVSASSNPTEVGFYDTGGNAHGVAISGNYAYVADRLLPVCELLIYLSLPIPSKSGFMIPVV